MMCFENGYCIKFLTESSVCLTGQGTVKSESTKSEIYFECIFNDSYMGLVFYGILFEIFPIFTLSNLEIWLGRLMNISDLKKIYPKVPKI